MTQHQQIHWRNRLEAQLTRIRFVRILMALVLLCTWFVPPPGGLQSQLFITSLYLLQYFYCEIIWLETERMLESVRSGLVGSAGGPVTCAVAR